MPYVAVKTNVSVDAPAAEAVKKGLGRAITSFSGKSERWLMCSVEGGVSMSFQGDPSPCAFVEAEVLGELDRGECEAFCEKVCALLTGEIGISGDRIYVRFSPTENWGWNGGLF